MGKKWVRINTIQGYEDIQPCYWISNADQDEIYNEDIDKIMEGWINDRGYHMVDLQTISSRYKYRIHRIKVLAFKFGPYPLNYTIIRHFNDKPSDNKLSNIAMGSQVQNMQDMKHNIGSYTGAVKDAQNGILRGAVVDSEARVRGGKMGGAITAVKLSKPVRCITTGKVFVNAYDANRQTGVDRSSIKRCCLGKQKTADNMEWEWYIND